MMKIYEQKENVILDKHDAAKDDYADALNFYQKD
jgi:hypothetical protein